MSSKSSQDSSFILQVKALLAKVANKSPLKDSLIERATIFYEEQGAIQYKKDFFNEELNNLNLKLQNADSKEVKVLEKNIARIQREQREYLERISLDMGERHKFLYEICLEIISLCEADDFDETNRKSAKLLGTIQLLAPTEGKKIALINELYKPIYKAILCLRLLDRLCVEQNIADPYIKSCLGNLSAEDYKRFADLHPEQYKSFIAKVKMPLVMAALLQDIGNYHPEAQKIMLGDGDDPHRMLEIDDRKQLLQINYRETFTFLVEGIGPQKYIGNSKADRDKFNQDERKRFLFIKQLLKSGVNPKEGIGNLLKVPQIYASIILSTKSTYVYKLLPKVYQALNQNAERGHCSQVVVDALRAITGDFPQGFGVIYIPVDSTGKPCERYEYAIVNGFYPADPTEPICRNATRNLTFISHGSDIVVNKQANLYYPEVIKKFSSISKERLNEILELLSSNFLERKQLDLLPRCWHCQEFFSFKKHQNIWNKTGG